MAINDNGYATVDTAHRAAINEIRRVMGKDWATGRNVNYSVTLDDNTGKYKVQLSGIPLTTYQQTPVTMKLQFRPWPEDRDKWEDARLWNGFVARAGVDKSGLPSVTVLATPALQGVMNTSCGEDYRWILA